MKLNIVIIILFLFSCCERQEENKLLGEIAYSKNEFKKAINYFNKYLECNDTSEKILFLRAKSYYKLGMNEKSLIDLKKNISLDNFEDYYYSNIGVIYFLQNNPDSAVKYLEKAEELGCKSYLSKYLLLRCYERLQNKNNIKFQDLETRYFKEEYFEIYNQFQEYYFHENYFNLNGKSDYVFLMYCPKNRKHFKGETVEGYLYLVGNLNTQITDPEYYLLNERSHFNYDTIQKLKSEKGIGYFTIKTDTFKISEDSLLHELFFGAKVKYIDKMGTKKDSMFYLKGILITKNIS